MLLSLSNKAQINLVPNYSFEDTIGDCQLVMIINTSSNSKVKNWTTIGGSSPDYMNICANSISYPSWSTIPANAHSYQYPHLGNAYVDIYTYYTLSSTDSALIDAEYLITQLKQPLKNNTCYYGEMFINLASISNVAINQISMLFSSNAYNSIAHSFTNTIQPQVQWDTTSYFKDTLNWVKVSGTFIAQGGEQFLNIGNFKDGTHLKKLHLILVLDLFLIAY